MILQALASYSPPDMLPIGYAVKPVGFVLRVHADATGCELVSRYEQRRDGKGNLISRWDAEEEAVPNMTRANNPPPILACDNAAFVIGLPKEVRDEAEAERQLRVVSQKRQAFAALLAEWVAQTGDPDGQIIVKWYNSGCLGVTQAVESLSDWESKRLPVDLIALQVGSGSLLHRKESAKLFWSQRMQASSGGQTDHCLVCGQVAQVLGTLPQSLVGSRIPDTATSQVALLSSNFPAFERGATGSGLKSAPICVGCGVRAVQSFNRLASNSQHRWGSSQDRYATIWWTKGESCSDIFAQLDNPAEDVARLFRSIQDGVATTEVIEGDRFYALTFSGNVARLVVRSWLDIPVKEAVSNIEQWFMDTAMPDAVHAYPSLSALGKSAGSLVKSQDKWREDAPEGAFDALLRSALTGAPPPRGLLLNAVARAKAEVYIANSDDPTTAKGIIRRRTNSRCGLIRLILNRIYQKETPLTQHLDETRSTPTYLSGRLFAVRESLQYRASGKVNASIVDRFFARASENPASVEHVLTALEKQHLAALRRKGDSEERAAKALDKRISELHDLMGHSGAPGRLTDAESAEWIAGYYQQRQHDIAAAVARKEKQNTVTSEE